jgi:CheY-like chemotaxis protein
MATILLVDDDDIARLVVRRMIERDGHEVIEAGDGQAALDRLLEGLRPDCIILDLMMPTLGGVDVLRRLSANPHWREIPVLLMTALNEGREVDEARSIGFRRHFVKAYWHMGDLLRTIEHATTGNHAPRPLRADNSLAASAGLS